MASNKGRRLVASIIVLIGAILLIVALLTPWYMTKISNAYATETQTFYPGIPSDNGTIQYSCSGHISCPSQTSYSKLNYNNTGAIAEAGFFMLLIGAILGIIAVIFGAMSRGNARRVRPAIALAVIALILALAAPSIYAVVLPGAVGKDIPNAARPTSSGPWGSFMGSSSFTEPIIGSNTLNWGPTDGWYLAFAAFVVLLIGVILLIAFRKDPPEPAPATVPAPTAAPAQTTPPS